MELRQLTTDDYAAASRLLQEAFQRGRRAEVGEPPENWLMSRRSGVFEGGKLVACATVHDMRLAWGGSVMTMGGVAGVACAAAQRGRGHVARLMIDALGAMRESGQILSGLHPFAYAFYRRFGWEWAGEKRRYVAPTREIRSSPYGRCVRTFEGIEAAEKIKPAYARFASRYRGMHLRDETFPNWWERCLDHHDGRTTYVHVYEDEEGGSIDGYLAFQYPETGASEPGRVWDFFALTPAAYKGLLSVLHYYSTQVEKVSWGGPMDDQLPLHLMHHDLEQSIKPQFMARIVDVKAALEALTPPDDLRGRLHLRVMDDSCDWNDGHFLVTVDSGHVTVAKAMGEPDLFIDIRDLSQAYWGQPSLATLRHADRIAAPNEAAFTMLGELLPPVVTYMAEFF